MLFAAIILSAVSLAAETVESTRVENLLEQTRDMSAEERAIALRALLNAGSEPSHVQSALFLAFELNEKGEAFDSLLAKATEKERGSTPKEQPKSDSGSMTLTAAQLESIRVYQRRQLQVRDELNISGGGSSVYPGSFGTGAMVTSDPIVTSRSWNVFQGPVRLDVPTYLDVTGKPSEAKELRNKVRQNKALSWTFYGVGVAGSATTLGGYIAAGNAKSQEEYDRWNTIILTGFVASLVGLIGGSFPANRANKLNNNFSKSFDIGQVQEDIDRYNEELRQELNVTPSQALQFQSP